MKEENPDIVLADERHGKIMPGFDTGNSPSELMSVDIDDKIVVHTTSAGTQGIANAKATAEYIKKCDDGIDYMERIDL